MNKKSNNPFLFSHLCLAVICSFVLALLFLLIHIRNINTLVKYSNTEKTNMCIEDWNNQVNLARELSLQITINRKFSPRFFQQNNYHEILLLKELDNYNNYFPLSNDFFLYYPNEEGKIFLPDNQTNVLDLYLSHYSEDSGTLFRNILDSAESETAFSIENAVFLMIPLRIPNNMEYVRAMLVFRIPDHLLDKRFQVVSGGIHGTLCLYSGNELLYSSQTQPKTAEDIRNSRKTLSGNTSDSLYSIYYLPDKNSYGALQNSSFFLELMLVLATVFLALAVARLFARESYKPIQKISDKYSAKLGLKNEAQYQNALAELDDMMDTLLMNNIQANAELKEKQDFLQTQLLQLLLKKGQSFNPQPYLVRLQIKFPGPYFFVLSVSFDKSAQISQKLQEELCSAIEDIVNPEDNEYIYTVPDDRQKSFSFLCSIPLPNEKEDLTDNILAVTQSYCDNFRCGIGNVYEGMSRISISWLESMDQIADSSADGKTYRYSSKDFSPILFSLSKGDRQAALTKLENYVSKQKALAPSLLLQQYTFTEFMAEIARIAREKEIELSPQSLSLMVCAGNLEDFAFASQNVINDFCKKYEALIAQKDHDEAYRIVEYINSHFTEYDLTLEKAAADLNVSQAVVRQGIYKITGKMYKDYLTYKKVEYAKELLLRSDLSVLAISQKVGYSTVSHFIKLFKDMTGTTPSKYRTES